MSVSFGLFPKTHERWSELESLIDTVDTARFGKDGPASMELAHAIASAFDGVEESFTDAKRSVTYTCLHKSGSKFVVFESGRGVILWVTDEAVGVSVTAPERVLFVVSVAVRVAQAKAPGPPKSVDFIKASEHVPSGVFVIDDHATTLSPDENIGTVEGGFIKYSFVQSLRSMPSQEGGTIR